MRKMDTSPSPSDDQHQLPGFRFHPTEEELLDFYLKGISYGKRPGFNIIGTVNIYRHDPVELPGLAKIGEREWYFFVPRDRRHANGGRPNRTTETGFWKATGSDRPIRHAKEPKRIIGLKKTLVFYKGRAPRGIKTDWVMNEYRLPDNCPSPKEDIVLCKVYRKATSMKVLERRAAMEEESVATVPQGHCFSGDTNSSSEILQKPPFLNMEMSKQIIETEKDIEVSSRQHFWAPEYLTDLQVPKHGINFDWSQVDLSLLQSPCMDNWILYNQM